MRWLLVFCSVHGAFRAWQYPPPHTAASQQKQKEAEVCDEVRRSSGITSTTTTTVAVDPIHQDNNQYPWASCARMSLFISVARYWLPNHPYTPLSARPAKGGGRPLQCDHADVAHTCLHAAYIKGRCSITLIIPL
ncbi:hypothetical protein H105_05875 [Trichophyton soudanense CBS 452.61]|uniref:Secreted protein n=1 Tax=Trichophyton soudanense CBS 452.61 TaxID=1215331 RepID=A0A022XMX0_TRISD|nr:hypothetical protein H105_05875 [Trichophyton soudanense CBS 452.61]